jgi:putative PIN family toxin of toxin-antitoxin system
MLKAVLDTVVFVRSLISPHGLWGQLVFALSDHYVLYLSRPVLQEILEVIERPILRRKYRTTAGGMGRLLEILAQADVVEIGEVPAVSRDPKDDKFLVTAVAARAHYLITEDEDLLVLKEYQGVQIVNAATFLSLLRERQSDRQ